MSVEKMGTATLEQALGTLNSPASKNGLGVARLWRIFALNFGADRSPGLNSPPAVSAPLNCGVADPGGLIVF